VETRTASAGELFDRSPVTVGKLLDRLPVKSKRAESRVVPDNTTFDNPPAERKKTRRLITRGEKKAQDLLKITVEEKDWLISSDESESSYKDFDTNDFVVPDKDEESKFSLAKNDLGEWDSDSDNLSTTLPRRSPSPSGPRRVQRRVLSSSRDPSKKELTRTKTNQDNPVTSPRKGPEKRNVPKEPTVRKAKIAAKGKLEDAFEKLKMYVFLLTCISSVSCGRSY
jgi:hypothetical protein